MKGICQLCQVQCNSQQRVNNEYHTYVINFRFNISLRREWILNTIHISFMSASIYLSVEHEYISRGKMLAIYNVILHSDGCELEIRRSHESINLNDHLATCSLLSSWIPLAKIVTLILLSNNEVEQILKSQYILYLPYMF